MWVFTWAHYCNIVLTFCSREFSDTIFMLLLRNLYTTSYTCMCMNKSRNLSIKKQMQWMFKLFKNTCVDVPCFSLPLHSYTVYTSSRISPYVRNSSFIYAFKDIHLTKVLCKHCVLVNLDNSFAFLYVAFTIVEREIACFWTYNRNKFNHDEN